MLESPTQSKLPFNTTLLHKLPLSHAKVPHLVTLVNLMVMESQTAKMIEEMNVKIEVKTAKTKGWNVERIVVMRKWKENRIAKMKGQIVERTARMKEWKEIKTVGMRRWRENRIAKMKG